MKGQVCDLGTFFYSNEKVEHTVENMYLDNFDCALCTICTEEILEHLYMHAPLLEATSRALPIFTSHKYAQDFKLWNCSKSSSTSHSSWTSSFFYAGAFGRKGIAKCQLNFIKEFPLLLHSVKLGAYLRFMDGC